MSEILSNIIEKLDQNKDKVAFIRYVFNNPDELFLADDTVAGFCWILDDIENGLISLSRELSIMDKGESS